LSSPIPGPYETGIYEKGEEIVFVQVLIKKAPLYKKEGYPKTTFLV